MSFFFYFIIFILSIDLQTYLAQIKEHHQGFAASKHSKSAADQKSYESKMIFQPIVSGNVHYVNDKKRTASPVFMGYKTTTLGFESSIAQKISYGTQFRLFYNFDSVKIYGTSPQLMPYPQFSLGALGAEVSQPLWRNFLGIENKAQIELSHRQSTLSEKKEYIAQRLILLQAQNTYLRLWLAHEIVEIQKEAYQRALKLKAWAKGRSESQLADKGDLLSAMANSLSKQIDLDMATQEYKAALLAFTSLLKSTPFQNDHNIEVVPLNISQAKSYFQKVPSDLQRLELQILEEQLKLTHLNKLVNKEKYKPQLELFASQNITSREPKSLDAVKYTILPHYPVTSVGVRLNMPLGGDPIKHYNAGLENDIISIKKQLEQKRIDYESEKKDLINKYQELLNLLTLIDSLKKSLSEKLQHEKSRLEIGRSTTFQTLSYEGEYSMAQLNSVKTLGELFKVVFALQLYVQEWE